MKLEELKRKQQHKEAELMQEKYRICYADLLSALYKLRAAASNPSHTQDIVQMIDKTITDDDAQWTILSMSITRTRREHAKERRALRMKETK